MRFLIMLVLSSFLLLLLEKPLKKHSTAFYFIAVLLAAAGYLVQTRMTPGPVRMIITDYLISGTLPAALFAIVMYAAVLPRKTRIFRCMMSLRGEIAILASLLSLTHIAFYGHSAGRRMAGKFNTFSRRELAAVGIVFALVLLLVPLTVTSFKWVHRRMNGKRWKRLQRSSYLFYGLLYLHAAMAVYPGAVSGNLQRLADLYCYTAVFGSYAALRVGKYLERKKKQAYCPAVWLTLVVLLTAGSFSVNYLTAGKVLAEETVEEKDSETEGMTVSENALEYRDGTWEGEGMGLNGPVRAAVVVENGKITGVKILERTDDDPYFTDARLELVPQILERQSADVDAVTGATFSSEGILEAVKEALLLAAEKE